MAECVLLLIAISFFIVILIYALPLCEKQPPLLSEEMESFTGKEDQYIVALKSCGGRGRWVAVEPKKIVGNRSKIGSWERHILTDLDSRGLKHGNKIVLTNAVHGMWRECCGYRVLPQKRPANSTAHDRNNEFVMHKIGYHSNKKYWRDKRRDPWIRSNDKIALWSVSARRFVYTNKCTGDLLSRGKKIGGWEPFMLHIISKVEKKGGGMGKLSWEGQDSIGKYHRIQITTPDIKPNMRAYVGSKNCYIGCWKPGDENKIRLRGNPKWILLKNTRNIKFIEIVRFDKDVRFDVIKTDNRAYGLDLNMAKSKPGDASNWVFTESRFGTNLKFKQLSSRMNGPHHIFLAVTTDGKLYGYTGDKKYRHLHPKMRFKWADLKDTAVYIDSRGGIYRDSVRGLKRLPGGLMQAAMGAKYLYGVNTGHYIYRTSNDRNWQKLPGRLIQVYPNSYSADVVGVNKHGQLYRWDGKRWHYMRAGVRQVVWKSNVIAIVNTKGQIEIALLGP